MTVYLTPSSSRGQLPGRAAPGCHLLFPWPEANPSASPAASCLPTGPPGAGLPALALAAVATATAAATVTATAAAAAAATAAAAAGPPVPPPPS